MLTELSDLQESDETVWGTSKVSFTIETREKADGKITQREYTFSHAPAWDKWTFQEFEERKTPDTQNVSSRNWRRSRKLIWNSGEAPTVTVPQEVSDQVENLLGLEELTLQTPGIIE